MKNLKKALSLLTAVATLAASTSAFASLGASSTGFGVSGISFSNANTSVSDPTAPNFEVTVASGVAEEGKQISFLVLDQGKGATTVEAEDILYIDQAEALSEGNVFEGKISPSRIAGASGSIPVGSYPVKIGYYAEGEFAIASGTIVVEDTTTKHTITFQYNGGQETAQVEDGATITFPSVTAPEHFSFKGWKVEGAADSTAVLEPNVTATAAITYVAVMEEDPKGTATFYTFYGDATPVSVGSVEVYVGSAFTVPTEVTDAVSAALPEHYSSSSWVDADGETASFTMVEGGVALYAVLEEDENHDASFVKFVNEEDNTIITIKVYTGDMVKYPAGTAEPTEAHKTFKGWSLTRGASTADYTTYQEIIEMGSENVTVYAVFEDDPTYTITFFDGDDVVQSYTNKYAGDAIVVPEPTKTGYNLIGWAATKGGSEAVTVATTVAGNAEYYAIWEAESSGEKITFKWGDVDCSGGDKAVNANDASAILGWITGGLSKYGDYTLNQEVTLDAIPEN